MRPLNLGILSVSAHFIKRILLPLREIDSINVYGIASRDLGKAQAATRKYAIPKAFGNYQDLLNDPEIDFVYIPLPNHMHLEWIKKSADAGKHILCEKPIAMNAEEAIEAVEYAHAKGVKIMEAFMYRFHPQWIRARELVQVGEIGGVTAIHTFFSYNNPDPSNIRNILEYGGGGLMDIGCYAISVPRFFLDKEPERVISTILHDAEFKTDKLTSAILDFGNAQATFTVATKTYPYQKVTIHGSSGNITVQIPFNTFPDVPATITVDTKIGIRNIEFPPSDHYGLQFQAFAEAIISDLPVPTDPDDAISNMKVIDAIVRSAANQKWEKI
ncbi:MAG: Gfo/Idh/MocA family protein [Cyclobacteriaceae bacterium]